MSLGKSLLSRVDGLTLLFYVLLVAVGITAIFSVEHRTTDLSIIMMNKSYMKQLVWFGYSLALGMFILLTDSKFFSSIALLAYTIGLGVLFITIFAGVDVKGSRSWLGVGSFRFQPGEVAKIFTSLALAKFLSLPENQLQDTERQADRGGDSARSRAAHYTAKGNGAGAGILLFFSCYVSRGVA